MRDYGNEEKLQSDWCRSVQNGRTTPRIASHQTLSPRVRVWLRETNVILAHVTWALAREWALFIRAAKTVTWALTREWALARDTTVLCSLTSSVV